jgi:hypothetical protein
VAYHRGLIKVHLAHDELVDIIQKEAPTSPLIPARVIYLAIALVAVIGIAAALRLAWTRK